jgi:hypothetical protein
MTPIETIAAIVAVLVIIKFVVILINPSTWINRVSLPLLRMRAVGVIVSLILAFVVLRYLLVELTIVQIFASMAFMFLIAMAGMMSLPQKIKGLLSDLKLDKKVTKKIWYMIVIWLILALWVLKELFV